MIRQLAVILISGAFLSCPAGGMETSARVWLFEGRTITELDPSTWMVIQTIAAPERVKTNPERLQSAHSGQIILYPECGAGSGSPERHPDCDKAWIWDAGRFHSLDLGCIREKVPAVECRESVRETCPRIAISYDGRKLFWFANEFETVREVDGPDVSVSTSFRAWQTDLAGAVKTPIANFSFPPCVCRTGACSETCPEADVWFPPEGIDDFFIVRHFIEGQLGSTPVDSFAYRNEGGKWSSSRFAQAFDTVLDAGAGGDRVIYAIRDSGCCGWDNDSGDQTLLSSGGVTGVIFDERERFSNPNYDVSFFTSKALLSPDASRIALNIGATQTLDDQIRLSSSGKEHPDELTRIREALKTMPVVEVIEASNPKSPVLSLPNASLVGWLNEKEVLVIRGGVMVRCDIPANVCVNTPLSLQKDRTVLIR